MLVVGLLLGYFGRPLISPTAGTASSAADSAAAASPTPDATAVADRRALSEALVSRTRHFKGDPLAPVTLIEFADFQ